MTSDTIELRHKKLLALSYPKNRKYFRQLVGLMEFGPSYLPFLFARLGLLKSREITAKLFFGKRMTLPLNRTTGEIYYLHTLPEFTLTKFFQRTLKPNMVFFDIGSNYGFYSFLAASMGCTVVAFEPLASVFSYVRKNIAAGEDITAHNTALADYEGASVMTVGSIIGSSTLKNGLIPSKKKQEVTVTTLDNFFASGSQKNPDILKIDVEGSEEAVLAGGKDFFIKNNPIVVMEIWGGENGEKYSDRAVDLIRSFGYQSYAIIKDGDIRLIDGVLSKQTLGDNFVFLKPSHPLLS